ncbi:hypothetical protein E2C01_027933 [Portunus trituberculatus]|uniref:Secreted protein n=1 Tax=Portunus trituberculatus TaxID=210409 RepID=A0A5B7EJD4_PORTR|nr:hypothetical protein [Portunus trituberculatus]
MTPAARHMTLSWIPPGVLACITTTTSSSLRSTTWSSSSSLQAKHWQLKGKCGASTFTSVVLTIPPHPTQSHPSGTSVPAHASIGKLRG